MTIIGITGKSGSGKNYISEIMRRDYKFKHIDLDKVGHKVLQGIDLQELVKKFGPKIELQGLTSPVLDWAALGEIVFRSPKKLAILEDIVHPGIVKEVMRIIKGSPANARIVINGAVLYKCKDLLDRCNRVYWVEAHWSERLRRLQPRDNKSIVSILKRMWAQRDVSLKTYSKKFPHQEPIILFSPSVALEYHLGKKLEIFSGITKEVSSGNVR